MSVHAIWKKKTKVLKLYFLLLFRSGISPRTSKPLSTTSRPHWAEVIAEEINKENVNKQFFNNFNEIEFCWRQIFEILIIHRPFLGPRDVSHKIWAQSVQPFWHLLDTNGQTSRQAKYLYRYLKLFCKLNIMSSLLKDRG